MNKAFPAARPTQIQPLSNQRARIWRLLPLLLLLAAPASRGAIVETFEDGSDTGDWRLTSDPGRLLVIEPSGGNPGAWLHGQVSAGVPTWYVPLGATPTRFLGNYAGKGVGGLSFDLNIFAGTEAPDRAVTLDFETTFGTGDFTKGVAVLLYWQRHLHFPGWLEDLLLPDRCGITDHSAGLGRHSRHRRRLAGAHARRRDVRLRTGQAGILYPILGVWDLGLDNVRITRKFRLP